MTQIVESLFGVSPERYQEQKDAALQQEALAYAKLDPYQRATAGIYAGARGLASGIGRMLGGEDPGMRRVTEQDQIIRSINLNDPETFGPAAQRAYQMGHTELAQKILLGADTAYQRQEVTRKRAADMQTRQQTQAAQQLIPSLMTPGRPEQVVSDEMGFDYVRQAQAAGIDQNTLRQLMATPAGRAELKSFGDAQKAMQGEVVKYGEGDIGVRISSITGLPERVVTGPEKYRPPVILSAGQMAVPPNDPRLTGAGGLTAPAAAPAAVKPPDKVTIMTALGYPLTPEGDAAYEAAKRAAPTVSAPTGTLAEMKATGIPETPEGLALYYRLKEKAPVVAPEQKTQEERNARSIALKAGPEGSEAFNAVFYAEMSRMTAKPAAAVKAEPTTNEMTNARAIALGAGPEGSFAYNQSLQTQLLRLTTKAEPLTAPPAPTEAMKNADSFAIMKGERGTPAYNKEFAAQMARLTAKSSGGEGGAGGRAGTGTIEVVDPKDRTKTIIVDKQTAVDNRMTPAKAIEGLTPQMRQKLEANYPQATSSLKGHQNKSTAFIKDLEALRDHPGLESVTGFAAGRAPGLTDAGRAAVALYDKVVAKGGFQALQDLRDASKTGGALGNVSNMEGKQLIASFAAIDRKQNAKDVKAAINQVIDDINGANIRLRDAYDLTYEYKIGNAAPAAGGVDANNPLLRGK